ncbi:hypothetical protein NQ315_016436 [Exocentrus adspersus]|uniref:Spaetzle domain-containing protein n=1 Tax=Exocentrus adspersus TaxID=1586481 RepID=A0AAV8VR01_9CUCU|nr:hypothetical protein NQ315_016436 [Exocentrus adspersus]
MSAARLILSIVLVSYGSDASFSLDDPKDLPLGPYFDTRGEYYVEDPLMEIYAQKSAEALEYDYSNEEDWKQDLPAREIFGRRLPEEGAFKTNHDKKSQTWCKVRQEIKHLREPGFEFFPKSYSEYDCVSAHDGPGGGGKFSSDVCPVKDIKCTPIQKTFKFFKMPTDAGSFCALDIVEKKVNVGCRCIHHKPRQ